MLSSRVRCFFASFGALLAACGLSATGTGPSSDASGPVETPPLGEVSPIEGGAPTPRDAAPETSPEAGCTNPAFLFDGDTDVHVQDDSAFDFKPSYTVEAWIRPDQASGEMDIVSHHDADSSEGFVLLLNSGRVEMRTYGRNGAGTTAKVIVAGDVGTAYVAAGTWMHVAGVLTADKLAVFVNGERKGLATISDFTVKHASVPLHLGRAASAQSAGFVGVIDEVRLSRIARYDPALSNVARPAAPFARDSDTITLWHLDEISGQSTSNDGDSKFDATLGTSTLRPTVVDVPCLPNR
jgi:hypothetical protein